MSLAKMDDAQPVLAPGKRVNSRQRDGKELVRVSASLDSLECSKGNQVPSRTTKFEKLLEAVPDALVGMDQKGVIRFVNRQTEALFGYDRDQLIGRPVETLVPEPLWQIYAQNRDNYFADPRTRSSGLEVELTGRHSDGTEFPINISMAHIDTGDVLLVITAVADVTRHQVAVRNARLLAAIVDASDDAIIGTTLEGVITSWNPAAERMYGYTAREIIGRSGTILATPGQGKTMYAVLAVTQAGEVVEHLEINHLRKDGSVVPISLTVAPISDENGTVVGSSAVARDVTEQRHAFEAAQRLAAIVESSQDAIFGSRLDGTITSWNGAAEALFGYSAKEIIGKSGRRLSPRGRAGETRAILARIGAGQRVENLEAVRVRKDGTAFPVSLTVSPIRDPGGAVVGASAILRDVTAQRRALLATQHLAAIFETTGDAILSGSLDGIITTWNPAAERLYGYSRDEIIGRSIDLLIPQDRRDETNQILAEIGAGHHVAELETVRVRKDGTTIPVSVTVSPICDPDGTVVATSAIHHDMTAHMLKLEAAERMAAIVSSSESSTPGA